MRNKLLYGFYVGLLTMMGLMSSPSAQDIVYQGRPVFKEGSDRGYFVWRDGDEWHVRWTTMGRTHRFTGRVVADGGKLKSLKRIDVETESRIIRAGRPATVVRGPRGGVRVVGGRAPVVATREEDKIEMDGDRAIMFVSRTDADIDGFDFKIDNVDSLRFFLEIDGTSRAADVEIGRNNEHPRNNPFVIRP